MYRTLSLSLLSFLLITFSCVAQSPEYIIETMYDEVMASSGHSFTLIMLEQIDGMMESSTMEGKVEYSSECIYAKMTDGQNEGAEILYNPSLFDGKALVKKGLKLRLDPKSWMMRRGMHNALTDAGFRTPAVLLYNSMIEAKNRGVFDEAFTYSGKVTFDGKTCYKIEINDPDFSIYNYTVKKSQSLYDLAKAMYLSEYLLAEINGWKVGKELYSGDVVKVTSAYGKSSIFYIDKDSYLPVYQRITDQDENLFEEYKFIDVIVNPAYSDDEFTENYPSYNF